MLYDESTKRWGRYTVTFTRTPWGRTGARLRLTLRKVVRLYRKALIPAGASERVYYFDPATLDMRDPKRERRMRRRDRRDRFFAKVSNALTAMVEMQKFIG